MSTEEEKNKSKKRSILSNEEQKRHIDRIQTATMELALDFANTRTPLWLMPMAIAMFTKRISDITNLPPKEILASAERILHELEISEYDSNRKSQELIVMEDPKNLLTNEEGIPVLPTPKPNEQ